jgi:hypothetical protein
MNGRAICDTHHMLGSPLGALVASLGQPKRAIRVVRPLIFVPGLREVSLSAAPCPMGLRPEPSASSPVVRSLTLAGPIAITGSVSRGRLRCAGGRVDAGLRGRLVKMPVVTAAPS